MMSLVPKIWAERIEINLKNQLHYQLKFSHSWNYQCLKAVRRAYQANRRRKGSHTLPRPDVIYRPPLFPIRGETFNLAVVTEDRQ